MKFTNRTALVIALLSLFIFTNFTTNKFDLNTKTVNTTKVAYFASGCFWCVEAIFESVRGVEDVVSGYAGGFTKNPTYESSNTGRTGHAEAVAVYYNPNKISFKTLVDVYFGSHNPTTKNGQYPDYGSQYRSIAFYADAAEKEIINKKIDKLNSEVYNGKIVTEVKKIDAFYVAEAYHQNFEKLHPRHPYIQNISVPRLNRFKKRFPELIK
ncbi:peptide-methionine (S)-S-oxide reductase MsrA [Tenacibaculum sp. AHE15PA]|uniref:peptide-methionine (S)-S-oxide reductase MsrA n=1 Tax=unclassified Tenacibaculum TaxID=2635139 RepID=UPI001C4E3F11|nr:MULTISPECIES: peptide-methionine (S)-S-oxide reductase MsrA [unclassified Tenacibaculum]QXP73731.1 peptide-methionine (S)-S-oxide reductase MsrA [Tenacibaculum sp. AHE14PA]QXP75902.1 peptide-methionine (S)-S-oxide reductase MsrA [Tenacibaculum sp. AHE15PA]